MAISRPTILCAALFGCAFMSSVFAQENQTAEPIKLPPACERAQGHGAMMQNGMMGDMQKMMGGQQMGQMQSEMMRSMAAMNPSMMQSMTIQDADVAFACSMIAHHMGAIAMAKTETANGKDEAMKKMAEKMIKDQEAEVKKMSAWVEKHAK